MFEVLIREANARFGVGDKALPILQILLARMTDKDTGALAGFLEQFKTAGLGPMVQSWLGGGAAAQTISNTQIENVLGNAEGLLSIATEKLGIDRDKITSTFAYFIPLIVGKLTPNGNTLAAMPAEVISLAAQGKELLAAPAPQEPTSNMSWLPFAAVAVAIALGLGYCSLQSKQETQTKAEEAALQQTPPPQIAQDAASETASSPASQAAPETTSEVQPPVPVEQAEESPASEQTAEKEPITQVPAVIETPELPSTSTEATTTDKVIAGVSENSKPMLTIYFDSGKAQVSEEFAQKSETLIEYLKQNEKAKVTISGFNDPTGNAALNAELSKKRAQAVQKAIIDAGIVQERIQLEKPVDTTDTTSDLAQLRRVEVKITE